MLAPNALDNAFRLSIVLPKPRGQAQRCDSKPILRGFFFNKLDLFLTNSPRGVG